MKRAILLIVVVAAVLGCGSGAQERSTFAVVGMHCEGCSTGIAEALLGIDGVVEAWADHEKGVAEAVYSPTTVSAEALKEKIEVLGYTVTGVTTVSAHSS